jgi:hypothetical protein
VDLVPTCNEWVPCNLGDEMAETPSMSCTIPCVGLERPSPRDTLVSPTVYVAGHGALVPLPCHFNLYQVKAAMASLTSDLEARLAPLLMMARNGDHDKCPWSEGPSYGNRQPPSHRVRMGTSSDRASLSTMWGFSPH